MTSENSIIFFPGGHDHDGDASSLIKTDKYSIYDFNIGFTGTISSARRNRQEANFQSLKAVISDIVSSDVLGPAGIRLLPNSIQSVHIAAGAVTAGELSANIVLINNVIRSSNFDGTIAANGTITSKGTLGWAITYAGDAAFDATTIRGTLTAGALVINNNNYWYSNGHFRVGSSSEFMLFNGSDLSVTGDVTTGNLQATGGKIAGFDIGHANSPDSMHTGGNFLGTLDIGKLFPYGSGLAPLHSNWQNTGEVRAGLRIDAPFSDPMAGVFIGAEYLYDNWRLQNGGNYSYATYSKIETSGVIEGNNIISNGNITAAGDITAYNNIHAYGTLESGDTITAGGTGVYYNASNLTGDRFGIAFGWDNAAGELTCIVNNDPNVRPFFYPDGYDSDRRLKENIQSITSDVLQKIYNTKIYEFDYKKDISSPWLQGKHSIGVMADELKVNFPEFVEAPQTPGGYYQVIYAKMIPHLLAAIVDLNARLKALEQQLGYNS